MEDIFPDIPEYLNEILKSGGSIDEIKLDVEGNWFHNGERFINKKIIDLFNRSINMTKDGQFVISYSGYVYPIIVEDTALFVNAILFADDAQDASVLIYISSGETEVLDLDTLHFKNNALYCKVRGGRFDARFKRSPCYEIMSLLEETDDIYYLNICGRRLVLAEK